ncbi:uncharacterized protein TNCV_4380711 [Trichonephila clavipes]|nr:uncharacterized protein TNCV_4380711 [Trichonephila clavipes]
MRCMCHLISDIVRQLGFSRSKVSREYMDGGQKTSDGGQKTRANCSGQLALAVRAESWLRRIVRSQRSQTFSQITTQLNDGANYTGNKRTVQHSLYRMGLGAVNLRGYNCSILAIELHVLPGQD